jgi:hemerythrin-like domain-containing protein
VLRDKNLVPLSHQHQHALALCVRIDRAIPSKELDVPAFQKEIRQIFEQEIRFHFEAEESVLFPAANEFSELKSLVAELQSEHALLREFFELAMTGSCDRARLQKFAELLSSHIRKEERQLFAQMQSLMTAPAMSRVGGELERVLARAQQTCLLPNEATRLRGKE